MKFLLICSFLFAAYSPASHADPLSTIKSIDDQDLPPSYSEASEEALPRDFLESEDYTVLSENRVAELFSELEKNPKARNRIAGGKCAIRRSYIQGYLKKMNITSGRLYIQCPSNRGHMKLIDQVTGHRYTFANFHDVNLVAVPTNYKVMDVQFESGPMTLTEYLAQVEASQKLKPLQHRTTRDKGYCYWSIR